jgi:hypothetical protein
MWERKTKLHEVYVKFGHLVDFIRLDPAEIRRLVEQTPLAVSAWVGQEVPVFVLVIRAHGAGLGVGWPVREGGWSK